MISATRQATGTRTPIAALSPVLRLLEESCNAVDVGVVVVGDAVSGVVVLPVADVVEDAVKRSVACQRMSYNGAKTP